MTREELRDYVDEQRGLDNIPYHVYSTLIDGIDTLEPEPCDDWCNVLSDRMTLEQARQAVKDLRKKLAECLWQEPCEDCISRQAVDALVDELARAISDERCFMSRGRSTATIMQNILDLPSVTPQQKTGHWIDEPYYKISEYGEEDTYYTRKCSECFEKYNVVFNYCPNCGTKMQEVEE